MLFDSLLELGKKYDVKNSAKRLEVAIPAKVSEDLRMWSEYVYENHAVEKVTDKEKQACLKEATESTDWVYDTIRQICGGKKVQ